MLKLKLQYFDHLVQRANSTGKDPDVGKDEGREVMTNLDSILKSRDITLLTKAHLAKAMVFPVVMYECEMDHKES